MKIMVHELPFPHDVNGAVFETGGKYHVALRAGMPTDEKCRVLAHEVRHILRGDIERGGDVQEIETVAHGMK